MQPTNLYFPSADTSVVNAGTGTNTLTKPAGVEVASIAPGSKYSRRINGPATFTTDFYSDERTFTVWFCAKPNVGVLAEMMGHEFVYTGYSFVLANNAGARVEIPEESPSSHVFVLSYADTEMSLIVDGQRATVDGNTLSGIDQIDVSLLNDGGILHIVGAVNTQYDAADLLSAYSIAPPIPSTVSQLSDNERADVNRTVIIDSMYVTYTYTRLLESVECLGFKVNFKQVGEGTVFVNGDPVESGDFISGSPQSLMLMPEGEFTVSDLVITEYYSEYVGETSGADVLVNGATGSGLPAFRQDDDGGARGEITVTIDEEVNSISGWFKATDGMISPGVSMLNNKLIDADFAGTLWEQDTTPPAGTIYRWTGTPHASTSEKVVDGEVVGRNYFSYRYLADRSNWTLSTYSRTPVIQLEPNTEYTFYAKTVRAFSDDEWGVLRIDDGTNGSLVYSESTEIVNIFNRRGPCPSMEDLTVSFTTPDSGLIVFQYYDHNLGNSPEGQWVTDKAVDAQIMRSDSTTLYFDGDFPDDRADDLWVNTDNGKVYRWAGEWVETSPPNVHVNGKPYSGQTLQGWYFLTRNDTLTEPFNITVPVHSLFFSEDVMSVNDVDDLYESFFGNPRASAGEEVIHMIEQPALIVSTEWNIVASG